MMNLATSPRAGLNRDVLQVRNVLLLIAMAAQLSRIVQVASNTGEVPFLSANDRSRWCTIAALAVTGSYEIDDILEIRDPDTKRRTWYSIDLVRHRGPDGKQHFYSSKPPLLPTLYAGVYMGLRALTGSTLMNDLFFVGRSMLVLVNFLPLVVFWLMAVRWVERAALGNWGTIIVYAFITWGTFLSTFVTTLNNHSPAALAVGLSLWCVDRIAFKNDLRWRWFLLCAIATSFGAANEMPALSWVAAVAGILFFIDARKMICGYVPGLLPVALAFFATNYWAHGEFIPAYAHRDLGAKLFEFELEQTPDWQLAPASLNSLSSQLPSQLVAAKLLEHGIGTSGRGEIRAARRPGVLEFWDDQQELRFGLRIESVKTEVGPESSQIENGQSVGTDAAITLGVYEWGDWYDYPGSYWTSERKQGVDKGEANRGVYIFHSLIGHHGIFSLTPFWLVSLLGVVVIWWERQSLSLFVDRRLLVGAAILATSLVAVGFYLARPLEDRNYGGVCSGFRWVFWMTPLWIWLAVNGIPWVRRPGARRIVEFFLAVSVFSACFPWTNPWTSPWLMRYWEYLGWIRWD